MAHDPAIQIAVQELERAEIDPHNSPWVTGPLWLVTLIVGLIFASVVIWPGQANFQVRPAVALLVLASSIAGFCSAGPLGRWCARLRLQRHASWISNSPNRSPGIWYESRRRRAIGASIFLAIVLLALSRPANPNHTPRGRKSRANRPELTAEQSNVIGNTIFGIIAVILGVVAARSWIDHRRFGASRLVTDGPDVVGGQTIAVALEATEQLSRAREVRFDLAETGRASMLDVMYPATWKHGLHVRATATVSATAFQTMAGMTVVRTSLAVPADARASAAEDKLGFHLTVGGPYFGYRLIQLSWEVRASADIDGRPYRARFPLKVVSATPPEPYRPRPIVIPPSDKIRPPSTST